MTDAILAAFFLGTPAVLVLLTRHVALADRIGPIVLCYAAGLLIGLSGLLPDTTDGIRTTITEASLGLALPLLLFSVDFAAWRHVAGRAMGAMLLAVVAVVFVASLLFHLFSAQGVEAPEQLSGMAVGMYTGGLANLGAIKLALDIPDARYLLFATVDTFVGALYLVFVLTVAQRIFGRFLPPFPDAFRASESTDETVDTARTGPRRQQIIQGLLAIGAAGTCVGLALALAPKLTFASTEILIIVLLTTFGLAASLIRPIRRNRQAPRIGMYLIYVFSFCVAASMDLGALADMDPMIVVFVGIATFGSLGLHALLCRWVRIDRDTFLITSVAALMSPAFVPMVARSLGNPAILMSGMATGILGFALGNYLGISVALLLAGGG